MTWLYNRTGGSLLLVIVWHGLVNFRQCHGGRSAIINILLMAQGVLLLVLELVARHRARVSVLGADDFRGHGLNRPLGRETISGPTIN